MADIYTDFKDNLRRRGLAYEGMLYRDVVEGGEIPYLYERYLFVGFNVIQKVEQRLFSDLKSKGMARFYWDYDRYYMGSGNEEGYISGSGSTSIPTNCATTTTAYTTTCSVARR